MLYPVSKWRALAPTQRFQRIELVATTDPRSFTTESGQCDSPDRRASLEPFQWSRDLLKSDLSLECKITSLVDSASLPYRVPWIDRVRPRSEADEEQAGQEKR